MIGTRDKPQGAASEIQEHCRGIAEVMRGIETDHALHAEARAVIAHAIRIGNIAEMMEGAELRSPPVRGTIRKAVRARVLHVVASMFAVQAVACAIVEPAYAMARVQYELTPRVDIELRPDPVEGDTDLPPYWVTPEELYG